MVDDERHKPRWRARRFPVPVDQVDEGEALDVGTANCPRCLVPAEPHEVFDALVCPVCGQRVDVAASEHEDLLTDAPPANVTAIRPASRQVSD